MSTEPTFQDLLADFSEELFVGRTAQLALFAQLFTAARPPFLILAISGQGGVGKTTLLEQFRQIADRHQAHHALVNEDHKSVLDVLASFAAQLHRAGHPCKTFDERYHKYRELKEQVEADPKAPKGFLDFAVRGATRIGLRALRRVPIAGDAADVFLSPAAEDHIVDESSAIAAYLAQKFTNKDERLLLSESVKELTGHILTDINKLATPHSRVILFFDTYEQTAPYLDPWLRDLIAGKYGPFSAYVTPIIAGRYPLGQPWTAFRRAIRQVELDPFTAEEAREYLERSGITDAEQIADFIKLSNRLPVLLAMLTFAPGAVPTDLSANAVERFLQGMTEDEREIALRSAVPRHFNQDILAALLGPDQAAHAFTWLSEAHFVRQGADGWRYHDVVRTLLLRYTCLRSNAQYTQMHEQMAAYYAAQLTQLGLAADQQRENRQWRSLEIERLYHTVAAQPATKLVELIGFLLLTAFTDLQQEIDGPKIRDDIKQTAQIITQLYDETHNESLTVWANHVGKLLTARDDLPAFTQAAKVFFPLLNALHALPEQAKYAAWLLLADLYRGNTQWPEAINAITHAIELCPNQPYGYTQRAHIHRVLKQYSEAITDHTTAITLNPTHARYYYSRGYTQYSATNYGAALDDFTHAIELQPDNDDNYWWRGRTYFETENYAAAIVDFTIALNIQPQARYSYHWRGMSYRQLARYEAALDDFTKAIEIEPNRYSYYWRARVYYTISNYSAALADFNKAIELQPDYMYGYFWRSHLYQDWGNYAAAIADLTRAIELDPNNASNYHWRGRAHHKAGNYTAAIADFTKAIELWPDDGTNYYWRGRIHSAQQAYTAALADLNCVIKLGIENAFAYHWRGLLHHQAQDYQAALTDFTQAATLQNDPTLSHFWSTVIHLTLHQPEEAQTALAKVEELLTPQLPGVPPAVITKTLARLAKIAAGQAKLNEKWLTTIFSYLPTDQKFKRDIRWLITYLTDLPHNDDALLLRQQLQDFLDKEHPPLS